MLFNEEGNVSAIYVEVDQSSPNESTPSRQMRDSARDWQKTIALITKSNSNLINNTENLSETMSASSRASSVSISYFDEAFEAVAKHDDRDFTIGSK